MKEKRQHRIVYKREGLKRKIKRYDSPRFVERFLTILGPEPWKAFGQDPDKLYCCSGHECGCGGMTVREKFEADRREMPKLEYVAVESRTIGSWEQSCITIEKCEARP